MFSNISSFVQFSFQYDTLPVDPREDTPANLFLAKNARIQFGNLAPDATKIEIFRKLFLHRNWLSNTLPTSSQPISGDYCKGRYVRKRVFGVQCTYFLLT